MKNVIFVLAFIVLGSSCSNTNEIPEVTSVLGKVLFVTKVDNPVTTVDSRSQSGWGESGAPYVSKFKFYAFRQYGTEGSLTYKLEKIIQDTTDPDAVIGSDKIWSSKDESSLLPVGKYKFISFYNLGNVGNNGGLSTELPLEITLEDAKKALIRHTDNANDINEIFSGIKEDIPVTVGADNEVKVDVVLTRMVSRVDVKFVKVSSDNNSVEIPYKNSHTIFGESKDAIAGILIEMNGLSSSIQFDKSQNGTPVMDCSYHALLLDKLTFGTSSLSSVYPGSENNFDADASVITTGIIQGGAYLKGAYVFPFASADDKMSSIKLTLEPKDKDKYSSRTITVNNTSSFPLSLQVNYVTLVTVKLVSTTDSGNTGGGNDDEHLFNPKTKLIVTINKAWGGSIDVPVEVH